MSGAGLLPKVVLFVVVAVAAGSVAFVGVVAAGREGPRSQAGIAPSFVLATPPDTPGDDALTAAFDLVENGQTPEVVPGLPPADLAFAAAALLGNDPVVGLRPPGFPRVDPITQFDGTPLANANCTLAAGAMLARLGFGIVTSGGILRGLQDDQVGGTGLDDLATALWRGYGVAFSSGAIRPAQLRALVEAGYGAVIQGDYARVPTQLRLQPSFGGPHAIYIDGYYPGDPGTPRAYYVIDPLGRPSHGYDGDWWPASVVEEFATGLGLGGGRLAAAWAFPPGGSPPDVVGPDVLPIPASGDGGPTPTASPGASPDPGATPGLAAPPEPGDTPPSTPVFEPPIIGPVEIGHLDLIPILLVCIVEPKPPGCPGGVAGRFEALGTPVLAGLDGPRIDIRFVDTDRPNVVLVGFSVDRPASSHVRFWEADGSPPVVEAASSMTVLPFIGETVVVARLEVLAGRAYQFQVVAETGTSAGASPVGTFTTGSGVARFDAALGTVVAPTFDVLRGLSPYVQLAPDAFAPPVEPCLETGPGATCQVVAGAFGPDTTVACSAIVRFDGAPFCLARVDPLAGPPVGTCHRATVDYELVGSAATGVLVRAFPASDGVRSRDRITLRGVLEAQAEGPAGQVEIGCLAPGMTYTIALDAIGDDGGLLAMRTVSVP